MNGVRPIGGFTLYTTLCLLTLYVTRSDPAYADDDLPGHCLHKSLHIQENGYTLPFIWPVS